MEEPYAEGVAIHGGPEPCVGDPRGRSEALDRGTHRPAIEPRNGVNRGADVVMTGGRQHRWWRYARVAGRTPRGRRTCACAELFMRENREIPLIALPPGTVRAARGRLRPHARDARVVGSRTVCVVPAKPSNKAAVRLRRWWREGGSARGTRPAQRAPDTTQSRNRCVKRAGPRASVRAGVNRRWT